MVWENREVSGASGMQVPYYSIADDLSPFMELDKVRVIIGGIFEGPERKCVAPSPGVRPCLGVEV